MYQPWASILRHYLISSSQELSLCRWGHWGSEGLSNVPKVTQLLRDRPGRHSSHSHSMNSHMQDGHFTHEKGKDKRQKIRWKKVWGEGEKWNILRWRGGKWGLTWLSLWLLENINLSSNLLQMFMCCYWPVMEFMFFTFEMSIHTDRWYTWRSTCYQVSLPCCQLYCAELSTISCQHARMLPSHNHSEATAVQKQQKAAKKLMDMAMLQYESHWQRSLNFIKYFTKYSFDGFPNSLKR